MTSLLIRLRAELSDLFGGAEDLHAARAKHLQSNIAIALFGSLGTSVAIALFMWRDEAGMPLIVWLVLSIIPALIRGWLWRYYATTDFESEPNPAVARWYLSLSSLAALLSGLVFGIGWAMLVPFADMNNQLIYLLVIIALLFGGLHTYSPNFITYLAFSATSIWIVPVMSLFAVSSKIDNLNFFIALISLLSTMFAMRFSLSFQHNHQLRKNVEHLLEEVTRKHQQALAASAEKSKFLASVSHDLRQPMHAVSLNVATISTLISKDRLDDAGLVFLKEQTNRLAGNVNYLNEMFDALLNMSRLEAGITAIEMRPIPLCQVIERIGREYQQISAELNLPFSIMGSIPSELAVMSDASALERILRNLISNAFKNTRTGGVRLHVITEKEAIHIRVVDTGIGIAKNVREKIFQDFVQIQNHQGVRISHQQFGHSFGLGLAIARRLAERLQIRIRCHSWVGKGSVFSFSVPRVHTACAPSAIGHALVSVKLINDALVVMIDDDVQILESTAAILRLHGLKVIAAPSSAEAISQLHDTDRKPDLLLTDFRLQDETGIDAISLIREEFNFDIPALIITGETSSDDIHRISRYGYRLLFKPLSAEVLLQAISEEIRAGISVSGA